MDYEPSTIAYYMEAVSKWEGMLSSCRPYYVVVTMRQCYRPGPGRCTK